VKEHELRLSDTEIISTRPMQKTLRCEKCGETMFQLTKNVKDSTGAGLGCVVALLGFALLFMFPFGTIIGIMLMIASASMGHSKKKIWQCDTCGYFFERAV
jgi:ribosomal protein L37AE/L43A